MAENIENNNQTGKAGKVQKDIELRSEKVRNIVGRVPPLLLRIGIAVISIIIISLLIAAYFLPYREYKNVEVELFCRPGYQSIVMPENGNVFMTISSMQVRRGQQMCYIQTVADSVIKFYSRLDGKVLPDARHGDFLRKGEPVYTIIPDSITSVYGIAYVPEEDIARISTGQPVGFVSSDRTSLVSGLLEGYISEIYPVPAINRQGKSLYKIEIMFPGYKPAVEEPWFPVFFQNMKGNGKILLSECPVLKRILGMD
jgi:hypothetical protein